VVVFVVVVELELVVEDDDTAVVLVELIVCEVVGVVLVDEVEDPFLLNSSA